jgi:hypothetical protein
MRPNLFVTLLCSLLVSATFITTEGHAKSKSKSKTSKIEKGVLSCKIDHEIVTDESPDKTIKKIPLEASRNGAESYTLAITGFGEKIAKAKSALWHFNHGAVLTRIPDQDSNGEKWYSTPNTGYGIIVLQTFPDPHTKEIQITVYYLRSKYREQKDITYSGTCI